MGLEGEKKKKGPAEIWTRIVGFRVRSANRYTTEPWQDAVDIYTYLMQLTIGRSFTWSLLV